MKQNNLDMFPPGSFEDAIFRTVNEIGVKKVATILWPDHKDPQNAADDLLKALDPKKRRKLSGHEYGIIIGLDASHGYHYTATWLSTSHLYEFTAVSKEVRQGELIKELHEQMATMAQKLATFEGLA